jgi:hypothetical protein
MLVEIGSLPDHWVGGLRAIRPVAQSGTAARGRAHFHESVGFQGLEGRERISLRRRFKAIPFALSASSF